MALNWMHRDGGYAATGSHAGIYIIETKDGHMLLDRRAAGQKPKVKGPFSGSSAAMDAAHSLGRVG